VFAVGCHSELFFSFDRDRCFSHDPGHPGPRHMDPFPAK
jgi:hypothetical protein